MANRITSWLKRIARIKDPIGWALVVAALLAIIGAAYLAFPTD
jgi:hypothetical protein